MSLVGHGATESVGYLKPSKLLKQVEVVLGGQQESLVQPVSVLMPKAIQAIEASGSGVQWSTRQQIKQSVNYQLSLVAPALMQAMSPKTALKQDWFTESEGHVE